MSKNTYHPPVTALLTYGQCKGVRPKNWPDYLGELGFDQSHIPELMEMVTDDALHQARSDSLEIWAPTHAWRVLGLIGKGSDIPVEPLLGLLRNIDYDWAQEEIPVVIGFIGPSTFPAIEKYWAQTTDHYRERIPALYCLSNIGLHHPEQREQCLDRLSELLAQENNHRTLNAFLVDALCELNATEKATEIEQAFTQNRVDLTIIGDWDEVQVKLGFKTREDVPLRRFSPTEVLGPMSEETKALLNALSAVPLARNTKKEDMFKGFGAKSNRKKRKAKKKKR